jgi:hypothetical protein
MVMLQEQALLISGAYALKALQPERVTENR